MFFTHKSIARVMQRVEVRKTAFWNLGGTIFPQGLMKKKKDFFQNYVKPACIEIYGFTKIVRYIEAIFCEY